MEASQAAAVRAGAGAVAVVRPFLDTSKSRLVATLRRAGIGFADDPGNIDPRFARARLRKMLAALAHEGLTARRLAQVARRVQRSEAAMEAIVDATAEQLGLGSKPGGFAIARQDWRELPAEMALRLLGRACTQFGDEGPVELGKLEALAGALAIAAETGSQRFRRTLAGAMVSLQNHHILVERAPSRRHRSRR